MQLGRTETRSGDESKRWSGDGRSEYRQRAKRRAKEEARRQRENAKAEIGEWAFDTLESYFPEQAAARRRQTGAMTFVVGVAVGVLLRHLMSR